MLDTWINSISFWFKSWHYEVGEIICQPFIFILPKALQSHCTRMMDGFFTTFELVAVSIVLSFSLAKFLTQLLFSGPAYLHRPIKFYMYFFQGTPVLIQLWLMYYGLAQFAAVQNSIFWIFLSSGWWIGLLVLTLNSAAYQVNLLDGAIRNLPYGQIESGRSLGLSNSSIFNHILFPQALRLALPALTNEAILVLKASALVSTITVLDLMGHSRTIFARSYDLSIYGAASILYISLTGLITFTAFWIRRHLTAKNPL